jgi:hypothetical protein
MKLEIQRTDDDTKTRFTFSGEISIARSEITTMHEEDVEFLRVLGGNGLGKGSESLVALALLFSAAEQREEG